MAPRRPPSVVLELHSADRAIRTLVMEAFVRERRHPPESSTRSRTRSSTASRPGGLTSSGRRPAMPGRPTAPSRRTGPCTSPATAITWTGSTRTARSRSSRPASTGRTGSPWHPAGRSWSRIRTPAPSAALPRTAPSRRSQPASDGRWTSPPAPDGSTYVADLAGRRLLRLRNGATTVVARRLGAVTGVAVARGAVYVTLAEGAVKVARIAPNGTVTRLA